MKLKIICSIIFIFVVLLSVSLVSSANDMNNNEIIYVVKSGDTLSKIAKEIYGDSMQYTKIYESNGFLTSPDLIHPGQKLRIPTINQSNIDIQVSRSNSTSRFTEGPINMSVTSYSLDYRCCGKYPSHPEYGITYSGKHVEEWNTVAAGREIPIGTIIYIPYFKDKPNKGIFTVTDRGSGVKRNCIDVYMDVPYKELMRFGRKTLEVYIIERGE